MLFWWKYFFFPFVWRMCSFSSSPYAVLQVGSSSQNLARRLFPSEPKIYLIPFRFFLSNSLSNLFLSCFGKWRPIDANAMRTLRWSVARNPYYATGDELLPNCRRVICRNHCWKSANCTLVFKGWTEGHSHACTDNQGRRHIWAPCRKIFVWSAPHIEDSAHAVLLICRARRYKARAARDFPSSCEAYSCTTL